MKDLWADLNVDGDDDGIGWSLEQLERELSQLDDHHGMTEQERSSDEALASLSVANMVVSHSQGRIPSYQQAATADAWSQSLANFSALSLEHDFLAADSARKSVMPPPGLSSAFLEQAEEYDVAEQLQAPPGMMVMSPQLFRNEQPLPEPPTPQNSTRRLLFSNDTTYSRTSADTATAAATRTPQNSIAQFAQEDLPPTMTPQNSRDALPMMVDPSKVMMGMQEGQTPITTFGAKPKGSESPEGIPIMSPPHGMSHGIPLMSPVVIHQLSQQPPMMQPAILSSPTGLQMPAWQTNMPPTRPIFANVHPNAPPVPARALVSSLMTSRDLAYVIHAMLKPVLMMGTSTSDYHMKLLQRQAGPTKATPNKKEKLDNIMSARAKKTAEWKDTKKILGSNSRSDITRPRALIATPTLVSDEDFEQKSRASLWKARLFIDQGYYAMNTLVEVWQQHAPGSAMPTEVHTHLLKLLKCLGMSVKEGVYSIEPEKALKPILKMTKGQIFIARLLEQALLPPKAVVVLLPHALEVSVASGTPNDMADSRLFGGYARVISSIPLDGETLLECIQKVQTKEALQSQSRMECVHALLRVGSMRGAQDPNGFGQMWNDAETAFLQLLS